MSLFVEQKGAGPDLVLIHGWGAHGGIWSELTDILANTFRLTIIDLPGAGRSKPMKKTFTLENVIAEIKKVTPQSAIWLGWSLGALIVQSMAITDKTRVKKFILFGGSPCFARKNDWPCATEEKVLNDFGELLRSDAKKTLSRFLSLQMGNDPMAREVLRKQREQLFEYGEPDIPTLNEMLDVLKETDLRSSLNKITQPGLLFHGTRDTLAPIGAAEFMRDNLDITDLVSIENGGHIPFLTHTDLCVQKINEFCVPVVDETIVQ